MSYLYKRPGSPYFYYGWTDEQGVRRSKVLKARTADRVEAEVYKKLEDRKRGAAVSGEVVDGIPWRQFKPEFLQEYRGRTLEIYESTFRLFENLSTPTVVSAYTYNHAKEFKASLRAYVSPATKRPLKDNSVNIHLRNMHSAFNEAVRLKYALKNPFADVRPIPVTKRVPRYLSIEQVRHLLVVSKKSTHSDIYPMLLFFLYTGMRLQELTILKWTAFDLDRGVMYLHGSEGWEPKDREEHAIGLHGEIAKLLKRRESREGYVFTGKAGKRRDARATGRLFNA